MTRRAVAFFHENLEFYEMAPADDLVREEGGYVLAKPGEVYAVYIPTGGSASLDLQQFEGEFSVDWFNPAEDGPMGEGGTVSGPGVVRIGPAPGDSAQDWVALVRSTVD